MGGFSNLNRSLLRCTILGYNIRGASRFLNTVQICRPCVWSSCLFAAGKALCQLHVSNWMSTISRPFMHPGHLLPHSPEHWLMMSRCTPMSTVYTFSLKHFYSGFLVIHSSPSSHSILPSLFFKPQGIFRIFFLYQFLTYIYVFQHACISCAL